MKEASYNFGEKQLLKTPLWRMQSGIIDFLARLSAQGCVLIADTPWHSHEEKIRGLIKTRNSAIIPGRTFLVKQAMSNLLKLFQARVNFGST